MTDSDLARLTAEMCGLKIGRSASGHPLYDPGNGDGEVWNPCDSIEQAFMVQERIREMGLAGQYQYELVLSVLNRPDIRHELIFATPRQRVEAAVRAWKSQPTAADESHD